MPVLQALIILIIVIVIVWWALRRSASESAKEASVIHEHAEHEEHVEAVRSEVVEIAPVEAEAVIEPVVMESASEPILVVEPAVEVKPDDLVLIEGIGPKISGILKSNGIMTFAQLAGMQPDEIKAILTAVDVRLGRIADPTTWPQQAELAAKGDLEGLQKLQDSLKGGKL